MRLLHSEEKLCSFDFGRYVIRATEDVEQLFILIGSEVGCNSRIERARRNLRYEVVAVEYVADAAVCVVPVFSSDALAHYAVHCSESCEVFQRLRGPVGLLLNFVIGFWSKLIRVSEICALKVQDERVEMERRSKGYNRAF